MRLIGGKTEYEGTLLLCINNAWGTICQNNGWNNVEAQVACNNLGYRSGGATHYIANLGNLFYPIFTRDFSCTLTENLLYNCSHISSSDDTHCGTHYYDVELKCEGKYLSSVLKVLHFAIVYKRTVFTYKVGVIIGVYIASLYSSSIINS